MSTSYAPSQDRDACLALTFIILLVWLFWRYDWLVYVSMAVVLYGMVWPAGMRPFTCVWFGLSQLLSRFVGSIVLGIIWCVLVIPVGLARRMMGKDSMRLKKWRQNQDSVFVNRDHTYNAKDISAPY